MARLRENVVAARRRLTEGHELLKERHARGATGMEISAALADLRDEVLRAIYAEALESLGENRPRADSLALVAHGGYGRRDVAPFSDVDVMILSVPRMGRRVAPLAERMLRDVFDAGLILGHSVRTADEACRLACQDPMICTSLVEARLLAGSTALFEQFVAEFRRRVRGRASSLVDAIDRARSEERIKYGETVYLLEPNVKRSRGGLRDIQLIRWIGQAQYGARPHDELVRMGALSAEDAAALAAAGEFLLWLRNEMHFQAGRASDLLNRAEQLRIADRLGLPSGDGLLAVERFMRDYFRHTNQVSHVVGRFMAKARSAPRRGALVSTLFGHLAAGGFRVGPRQIMATREGIRRIRSGLAGIMQLVDLANLYDKEIAPETWEIARAAAAKLPGDPPAEAVKHFCSLLSHPTRLGELLRAMHEAALLERFIPGFAHARGLLQFNQYHKYTVDEHCLRAVEQATDFRHDKGPLGIVYRGLARKNVLHLALLIHDLGKGHAEEHCEVGRQIARDTAGRLGLDVNDAEALEFLVYRHLMMNHLAFRRDTSDEQLIVRFAAEVGSPEVLQMLYLTSAADMGAVSPDAWTNWKAQVVTDLYERAMQYLAGETPALELSERLEHRRDAVRRHLGAHVEDAWYGRQVATLPPAYLSGTQPERIAADLRLLRDLPSREVKVESSYQAETETVQFLVATTESVAPGVFHRLTGALTGQGLEILSAEINTLPGGLVIDRFHVRDPDYASEPPAERRNRVHAALEQSLRSPDGQPAVSRTTWRLGGSKHSSAFSPATRVQTDNHTSAICTVFDIFAIDRPGLLYAIARTLFEAGVSVWRAKIGTFLDQVADVFYVTDQDGRKIEDESRLEMIRVQLLRAVQSLETK
jgi:[protein-PII] uridylyltransferase